MAIAPAELWRPGTMQAAIADALVAHDMDANAAYDALLPQLGEEPFVFTTNGPTGRVPLPRGAKRAKRFRYRINEVRVALLAETAPPVESDAPLAPVVPIRPKADGACQRDAQAIIDWIQGTLRPFGANRAADGKAFDEVGLRPAQNAAKMLTAGIAPKAIQHALTLHYPPEARRTLGVKPYDVTTFEPRRWEGVVKPSTLVSHDGRHKALPYVKALAKAGIPIALVGPPGTGKTTLAEHLADDLKLDFGFVSMTRGTSPSAFNGRPKIGSDGTDALVAALIANGQAGEALQVARTAADDGDVAVSQFVRIFGGGGVFLFDEMDAAEPNLLLLVNAALANGHFANPATGEIVKRHPDFIPIAGMNTLGLGGDAKMVGRERQDAAALDRWHAGRVEVHLDEDLERQIFWSTVAV